MANNYWRKRTIANENYAYKMASTYNARLLTAHKNAYNTLNAYLEAVYNDIQNGNIVNRTELWQSKKYIKLLNAIRTETGRLQTAQQKIIQQCLEQVFDATIGRTMASFDKTWDTTNENVRNQIINGEWLGSNYSARIWKNTNTLGDRLQKDLTDWLLNGKGADKTTDANGKIIYKDIAQKLSEDMNVSYKQAHRLLITEAAHVHTEASKEGYRQAGVDMVEWIAENDEIVCDICKGRNGKQYQLNNAPQLPEHCYCRCALMPVIQMPKKDIT